MARRSPTGRFPALRQGRRREMIWISFPAATRTVALGTAILHRVLSTTALGLRPFTIVRDRGWLKVRSDQAANTEQQWLAYAKIVVKETATTAGTGSLPSPLTEPNADYYVYEQISSSIEVVSAASVFESGFQMGFDSKAMRKVGDDDDIATILETPATGISEGLIMTDGGRTLVKLH